MRRNIRQPINVKVPETHGSEGAALLRQYDLETNPSRPLRSSPLTTSTVLHGLPLELVDRLRSFPLFASAPDSFLGAIGKHLRPQLHQPHDFIISEGEDARAMYWLVRGTVRVISRDGESTYAELKPGAFFGEIGILMNIPRTASVTSSTRSLVVRLNKEDLQKEFPNFPHVERTIREEAVERLAILERKKKEAKTVLSPSNGQRKRSIRDLATHDTGPPDRWDSHSSDGFVPSKKRKSPDLNGVAEHIATSTVLEKPGVTIRQILKELPLFSSLPPDILHYLGINAQQCTFSPFTAIIEQGSQGRDVYFIVQGMVEVVTENSVPDDLSQGYPSPKTRPAPMQRVRARLKPGQYFGEVTSLALSPSRTATVRTITRVECLRITSQVLDGLWQRCSPHLRQQVEIEAKRRLQDASPSFVESTNGQKPSEAMDEDVLPDRGEERMPSVILTNIPDPDHDHGQDRNGIAIMTSPIDPDPFFNADLEITRSTQKSRRSSLAPPHQDDASGSPRGQTANLLRSASSTSPSRFRAAFLSSPTSPSCLSPKSGVPSLSRENSSTVRRNVRGRLPDRLLTRIFSYLDLATLMQMRSVSSHWHHLASTDPASLPCLDLSVFNRQVTDFALVHSIAPFVNNRPHEVIMDNCYHITDEGFNAIAASCAGNVRIWRMRSVWDVNGQCILDLVMHSPRLEEIDLSNCRKVGDALLARIVSCRVMAPQSPVGSTIGANVGLGIASPADEHHQDRLQYTDGAGVQTTMQVGTRLRRLTLSYCKHIQDRGMAQLAQYAANRLEVIDLTRCTSVTDQGFQHWTLYNFPMLRKLVLADCTYLTDRAIVGIVNAARNLRELDLSFCCALSDTATEVLALGLTQLRYLDVAFCGSAVSDASLRCMGLHLLELRHLSVRGCVRVTGQGVEAILEGCRYLNSLDVSQCKNLTPWIETGGIERARSRGSKTKFELVANGSWRCPPPVRR